MIGVNYTAFLITKGDDSAGVLVCDGQSSVTVEFDNRVLTTPVEHLARTCARYGWSMRIETGVHLFGFSDDEVGLDEVLRRR